ncbi:MULTISPECIES: hypothetical protein [Burkholderia]|uniref:hypothetical protein n=1 Tax=Burkholderia TaxID=32008 RepID=UPI001583C93E|nr:MULTISPECIES: hypothetical protein [Burkholderia]
MHFGGILPNYQDLLAIFERMKLEWSVERKAIHFGRECPFLLKCCIFDGIADDVAIDDIPSSAYELVTLWRISGRADLFKDVGFGQWGIEVLPPREAVEATLKQKRIRGREFLDGDVVFARFYGDSELLLMDSEGAVYVSLPLDERCNWPRVADSLKIFLEKLVDHQGAKYWDGPKGVS